MFGNASSVNDVPAFFDPESGASPCDAHEEAVATSQPKSHLGLPTYDQYKNDVEARFLAPLSSAQRNKALISRANHELVASALNAVATLHDQSGYIRWAVNTFTLVHLPLGLRLHENGVPVAIQDELYDVLCTAHEAVAHDSFSATYAHLCASHAHVPRKLVAMFVKLCPTCLGARSGNDNLVDLATAEAIMEHDASRAHDGSLSAIRALVRTASEVSVGIVYGKENTPPTSAHELATDAEMLAYSESVESILEPAKSTSKAPCPPLLRAPAHSAPAHFIQRGSVQLPPMKRQSSLYAGLPNGWQFKFDDYGKAYKHFTGSSEESGRRKGGGPSHLSTVTSFQTVASLQRVASLQNMRNSEAEARLEGLPTDST